MKKPSPYIEIIRRFLPEDSVKRFCGADWGRETKACKDAIRENSLTLEQLRLIDKPPFQINSLNWFKTANGKKYVQEWFTKQQKNTQLSNQLKDKTVSSYELDIQPIESKAVRRPRTIFEFLSYGKSKI